MIAGVRPSLNAGRTTIHVAPAQPRFRPHLRSAARRTRPVAAGKPGSAVDSVMRSAATMDTISLEEVASTAALMNRIDTKFLLPIGLVAPLLANCAEQYRVVEVNGVQLCGYRTVYFDTPDLAFYQAHHSGRATRRKVRVRTYTETNQSFLEVKLKTNKDRTIKRRVHLTAGQEHPLEQLGNPSFAEVAGGIDPASLKESVSVACTRITLAGQHTAERVTIDLRIAFSNGASAACFPAVAIAEIKQDRCGGSHFLQLMKQLGVRPGSISKYCLGVMSTHEAVKQNRFKHILHQIHRISDVSLP